MAMASASCGVTMRQSLFLNGSNSHIPLSSLNHQRSSLLLNLHLHRNCRFHLTAELLPLSTTIARASAVGNGGGPAFSGDDDGVSLGTMKLPLDTDLQRFDSLLFQWANSLCQGANLPLPVPLKVDKIPGGARLSFITVGDGKTEVLVYIDCLVYPATENSAPFFRAIRNGPMKDRAPPGEPRIMRSLLQALQKSVEIARL